LVLTIKCRSASSTSVIKDNAHRTQSQSDYLGKYELLASQRDELKFQLTEVETVKRAAYFSNYAIILKRVEVTIYIHQRQVQYYHPFRTNSLFQGRTYPMEQMILFFSEVNQSHLPRVGGKGANLGELTAAVFPVPPGFCVTTSAYRSFIQTSSAMDNLFDSLDRINPDDLAEIQDLGRHIRDHLESLEMPVAIQTGILEAWQSMGTDKAYAVRSSATAEDLPGASFAGQQETYLNVRGAWQLLQAVKKCWASLFTDRAISYRAMNNFDHRSVFLSVVAQQMVFPEVSGIMFTADPISGHRKTTVIDASFGLGEALVSGIVSADLYHVRSGQISFKQISQKKVAIYSKPDGGTVTEEVPLEQQSVQALPDDKILDLAALGAKAQAHYGSEQDIEWCWAEGTFYIVQSRPITSLYPVPRVKDQRLHLFLSLGHMQMMTEPMRPLGISVLRTLFPIGKSSLREESELAQEAGSRLFADITDLLHYPQIRKRLPDLLSNVDELFGRTVKEFSTGADFLAQADNKKVPFSLVRKVAPTVLSVLRIIIYRHNDKSINELNKFIAGFVRENNRKLQEVSGSARITLIQEMLPNLLLTTFAKVAPYIGAGVGTYKVIENFCKKWLGDTAELGSISKSPPGNVTTEMGLALGDVANAVREHPAVITYLQEANDSTFWSGLKAVPGGERVLPIFSSFFARFGMRGTGEIDITRPRWRENPTQVVPAILNHLKNNQPGQHRLNFQAGRAEAEEAVQKLLDRLKQSPNGHLKSRVMRRLIKVHRSVIGIREHPKYMMVQILDLIKQALLQEADRLVEAGVLRLPEDIYWLSLAEINKLLQSPQLDYDLINRRQEKFQHDARLILPRAITSEGEIITAKPAVEVPDGSLAGSPVSVGTVEGRARVVLKLKNANLEKGDILVAPYTDPAWTPLFALAAGLVTEVGGLMTHGSVVAREYGIPAVVGVLDATRKIKDGQTIRVDGTRGIITILDGD
jgi:pyruvate,water dikinase